MEVEILYSNLIRKKSPLADIGVMPRTDVLFILFRNSDGKNLFSLAHKDHYAVKLDGVKIYTMEVNDEESEAHVYDGVYSKSNIVKSGRELIPVDWIIFTGAHIEKEKWEEVLKVFALMQKNG